MTLRFFTALLFLLCSVFAPLASYAQVPPREIAATLASENEPLPYKLTYGDTIAIRFFYNPEFNETIQIRPDGRISLGLIGELPVTGLTIAELTAQLEARYKDVLRRPGLTIQVTNYASQKFFVGGEVQRPGMFLLAGRQTVLGAILEAGGMTKTAKSSEVYLIRRTEGASATTITISLNELPEQPSSAATFRIEPYDVVVVAESRVARANRFVDQYIRQMIPMLLSGGFTYLLNSDGGFSPR